MKKILILFLLITNFTVKAQKFEFTTLTVYSTTFKNGVGNDLIYTSNSDNSFYLSILKTPNIILAYLYDLKHLKKHTFSVEETVTNGVTFYNFNYEESKPITYYNKKSRQHYIYDFTTIETNDSIEKVHIDVYKNAKRKKSMMTYEIDVQKNKSNLFHAFRISCIHPFEFEERFMYDKKGIVIKAKGKTLNGTPIEHQLLEHKEIVFELTVPKN